MQCLRKIETVKTEEISLDFSVNRILNLYKIKLFIRKVRKSGKSIETKDQKLE
jgi:hypothetical protein